MDLNILNEFPCNAILFIFFIFVKASTAPSLTSDILFRLTHEFCDSFLGIWYANIFQILFEIFLSQLEINTLWLSLMEINFINGN